MKTDYKVGDKVRVVSVDEDDIFIGVKVGDILTVDFPMYSGISAVEVFDGENVFLFFEQIEPVEPVDQQHTREHQALAEIVQMIDNADTKNMHYDELSILIAEIRNHAEAALKGGK